MKGAIEQGINLTIRLETLVESIQFLQEVLFYSKFAMKLFKVIKRL